MPVGVMHKLAYALFFYDPKYAKKKLVLILQLSRLKKKSLEETLFRMKLHVSICKIKLQNFVWHWFL